MKMHYLSYCIYELMNWIKNGQQDIYLIGPWYLNQLMVNDRFKKRIDKYINF